MSSGVAMPSGSAWSRASSAILQPMSPRLRLLIASLVALPAVGCGHDTAPPPMIPPPGATAPLALGDADDDFDDFDAADIPNVDGDAVVKKVVELGHTDNRVMAHLEHLTEKIGPRLTGSHQLMEAEQWCVKQFKSWGLPASLERWGEAPVGFDRGPWSGGMVSPEKVDFDFITPSWTPGSVEAVPAPAVAYPRSVSEAKKNKKTLAGAWLVRPKKFDVPSKTIEKIEAVLKEIGIAGVVRGDRDKKGELVHTSGRMNTQWEDLASYVTVVLRGDQHDALMARLDKGEEVTLAFSIDNRFFRGPVPLHNVVADIVGSERPDEMVIVGGHLDSWDGATGANDNGTGVATTMEAARLLVQAGARPKRTIRFVLWTGEEQGLLGSRGYVETHASEMDKVSAVFVHDMGTNYLSGIGATPEMMPQMEQVFAPVKQLSPEDMPFVLRETESLQTGGSDHTPYIRAGVPGFFWDQEGTSDYGHVHHTQFDTVENVIEDYQLHSAMVVALAAYQVANLPEAIDRTNSAPIPRRRMGVSFGEGLTLDEVTADSVAAKAGWKVGDKIISIDGKEIDGMRALFGALRGGDPKKTAVVERKGKPVSTTLDWGNTPGEVERAARRRARGQ